MSEKEIKYSELKSRKELYKEKYVRVVKKIIANDNIKDLKELKDAGIDLTTIIGSDKYTWNYAAEKGAVNCLEFLLENFHNLKILKDDKERVFYTILSSTIDTNKMIKMLSFYGKYFKFSNETNNPSQTPVLTELLKNELTEVAIYLFENGCNLLYVENEKIISPIEMAIQEYDLYFLKYLKEKHNISILDYERKNIPLFSCIERNSYMQSYILSDKIAMGKFLIDEGVDVYKKNNQNQTALEMIIKQCEYIENNGIDKLLGILEVYYQQKVLDRQFNNTILENKKIIRL